MPDKNKEKTFNRQEKNRKLENQRLIDFEIYNIKVELAYNRDLCPF